MTLKALMRSIKRLLPAMAALPFVLSLFLAPAASAAQTPQRFRE